MPSRTQLVALSDDLPAGVQSFVVEVVADQQYEIGVMEQQLRAWGHARQDDDGLAMGWMGHAMPDAEMPGLASQADLDRLADLRGDGAAALWLTLMRAHHEGGVAMASVAAERAGDPFVRTLAARMARNQRIEITEYDRVRQRLGL